ncbi:MAG: fused response regulator/phosphatase [Planctomycetaceae bacterium]|nr:fused response regulator/phosphatase [Planctomycetaceae bacterium]
MKTSEPQGQILVVDADEGAVSSLSGHLQRSGFDVLTASCGKDALTAVEQLPVDLLLLSTTLPDMKIADLLQALRQQFPMTELPIIVNAAANQTAEILSALHCGANDCIDGRANLEILLARIQTNVILKRTTEALQATNKSLTRMQRKLDHDLQAAARIQKNQMPSEDLEIDGWEVAWHAAPCDTLGGDSLNVIRLDDENWAMFVLDVSGHGVPASLLAVSVTRILTPGRDGSGRHDTLLPPRPLGDVRGNQDSGSVASAVYVLERLQEKFIPEEDSVQYFTIVYATLNTRTGEMRIASGGHPSPILMRAGEQPQLFTDPDGPAIGLIPLELDIHFHEAELQLAPGDTLLLYSDGVIEAFNPDQVLFGPDKLKRSLQFHAAHSLPQVVRGIHTELESWRASKPQKDDETLLAIRRME